MDKEQLALAPWYLLTVQSNYEDIVQRDMLAKMADESDVVKSAIKAVVVPKESVVTTVNGKRTETERRIYPGYVMVQMNYSESLWHFIKKLKHVKGFLGGQKPSKMKMSDVKSVFGMIEASEEAPKHKVEYSIGQHVRIVRGPFTDFTGDITAVDYAKQRMSVAVTIFGRATPVELEFSDTLVS
jgi:transcription termination/antitermination protein NusG